jgi:site-specific recombinase XerD
VDQGLLAENPAKSVMAVTTDPIAPDGISVTAIDALLRASEQNPDPIQRGRDKAFLALLVYGGVRIQECCDIQVRDLDLPAGMLVIRRGKGGKARRIPLHPDAQRLLFRYLHEIRCPDKMPAIGSLEEKEPLLIGKRTTRNEQPWLPGVQAQSIRKRLKQLGKLAALALSKVAEETADMAMVSELHQAAQEVGGKLTKRSRATTL